MSARTGTPVRHGRGLDHRYGHPRPQPANPRPERPPAWENSHPLTLTETMRGRLRTAVHALLSQPGLSEERSDAVRLAAVVLLARSPHEDLTVTITSRELGRWVGVSASTISHTVRPRLTSAEVAQTWDATPEGSASRRTVGVAWRLGSLVEARRDATGRDPLCLSKVELSVLHALCEAVLGPGWTHRDGTTTRPGLLGERTGPAAATDRLGLLLAVLECRPEGLVRLPPGAVDFRGRLAATLARLLGRDSAAGAKVLARLEEAGVVQAFRSGPVGAARSEQLVIPEVAAAYRRMRRAQRAAGRPAALGEQSSRVTHIARGDQPAQRQVISQVKAPGSSSRATAGTATLHAFHAPGVEEDDESAGSYRVSGVAPLVTGDRPVRARRREDPPARGGVDADRVQAGEGALRAEKHTPPLSPSSPLGPMQRQVPEVAAVLSAIVPSPTHWQRTRLQRVVRGLLAGGEDDAMISARLRSRLAPLTTRDNGRFVFRRGDGLAWALTIGLPYVPGDMTWLECAVSGCRNLVRGRAADPGLSCDQCELAALEERQAAEAFRALRANLCDRPRATDRPDARLVAPSLRSAPDTPTTTPTATIPAQPAPRPRDPVEALPGPVREQLRALAAVAPQDFRPARDAALAAYTPQGTETPEQHARRVSAATATWCSITTRHARALATSGAGAV